jgi:hypothetical protein
MRNIGKYFEFLNSALLKCNSLSKIIVAFCL